MSDIFDVFDDEEEEERAPISVMPKGSAPQPYTPPTPPESQPELPEAGAEPPQPPAPTETPGEYQQSNRGPVRAAALRPPPPLEEPPRWEGPKRSTPSPYQAELEAELQMREDLLSGVEDPRSNDAIVEAAELMYDLYGIDPQFTVDNYTSVAAALGMDSAEPANFREELRQHWEAGWMTVERGVLYWEVMNGNQSPAIMDRLTEIEQALGETQDIYNSLPAFALKSAANIAPFMIDVMRKGAERGVVWGSAAAAAAFIGGQAGPQAALPEEIVTVPSAWIMAYTAGTLHGGFEHGMKVEAGNAFASMITDPRLANVPMDKKRAMAYGYGAVSSVIENLQIAHLPGMSKIMRGQFMAALRDVTEHWAVDYLKGVASNTVEEVAQQGAERLATEVLARMDARARGTKYETPWEEIREEFSETAISSLAGMAVIGGGTSIGGNAIATIRERTAGRTQQTEASQAVDAELEVNVPEGERRAPQQVAQAQEEAQAQEAAPPTTEVRQEGYTPTGTIETMVAGEEGKRSGYVTYEVEPERITIQDVVVEDEGTTARELVLEVARQHKGLELEWNPVEDAGVPAEESMIELRRELIESNPRGREAGLQWYEAEATEQRVTWERAKEKLSRVYNLGEQEAAQFSAIHTAIANRMTEEGIPTTPDQLAERLFAPGITEEFSATRDADASIHFVDETGADVNVQQIPEARGRVRALFAAMEGGDVHIALHEYFHAVERLALTPTQTQAFEAVLDKPRAEWTVDDMETLANGFEDYVATGEAPTPELKSAFQRLADMFWELVSFIRHHVPGGVPGSEAATQARANITMSPEFVDAYDQMFTTRQRERGTEEQQAQTEAPAPTSQAQVQQTVVESTVSPESHPPASSPVETAFDPNVIPVLVNQVDTAEVTLSDEVPNFKEGADEKGVVDALQGERYEPYPGNPIMLWERTDGRLEVITGRHRLELIQRLGLEKIPYAQIVREADGFTKEQAITLDAEANIREEKGTVADYANYFRHSDTTEEQASGRGLLDSHKGREGFAIGRYATDGLYSAFRNGRIGQVKAAAIAAAAPNNDALQSEGIRRASDLAADELVNYINLLAGATSGDGPVAQADLFGRDDTVMREAERLAKEAVVVQRELRQEYSALKSAVRLGKDAQQKIVSKYGFEPGDSDAMRRRMADLELEIDSWSDWYMNSDKHLELRARLARADGEEGPMLISSDDMSQDAPEGTPDTPTPIDDDSPGLFHTAQERTNEFRQWFGESKVVDENGDPKIIYHGTETGGFSTFSDDATEFSRPGFFFSDNRKVARSYAEHNEAVRRKRGYSDREIEPGAEIPGTDFDAEIQKMRAGEQSVFSSTYDESLGNEPYVVRTELGIDVGRGETLEAAIESMRQAWAYMQRLNPQAGVYSVYLRMENPLEVDAKGKNWNEIAFEGNAVSTRELYEIAVDRGHDGVIIERVRDFARGASRPPTSTIYAATDPTQIKSATANRGTFDPNDPSIIAERDIAYAGIDVDTVAAEIDASLQSEFDFDAPVAPWLASDRKVAGQWRAQRRVDMTGLNLYHPVDIAEAFSVYRHPRIELFHVIMFDADHKVVAHNVMTAGLPGMVPIIDKPSQRTIENIGGRAAAAGAHARYIYQLDQRMKRAGATSFMVMHNHPSGQMEASPQDASLSRYYAKTYGDKYQGQIVLDSDTFLFMAPSEEVTQYDYDAKVKYDIPGVGSPSLFSSFQDHAGALVKEQLAGRKSAVLIADHAGRMISFVPMSVKAMNPQNLYQTMRNAGGVRVIPVLDRSIADSPAAKQILTMQMDPDKAKYQTVDDLWVIGEKGLAYRQRAADMQRLEWELDDLDDPGKRFTEQMRQKRLWEESWTSYRAKNTRKPTRLYHTSSEQPRVMAKIALDYFGETKNPSEAGYILADGRMLDFSGRRQDPDMLTPTGRLRRNVEDPYVGKRKMEHQEIAKAKDLKIRGRTFQNKIYNFMSRSHAVRIDVDYGIVAFSAEPTPAQIRQLIRVINEHDGTKYISWDDKDGRSVTSKGTVRLTAKIINDVVREGARGDAGVSRLLHERGDIWRLKSADIVREKMSGPMPSQQVRKMLENAGVKQEELYWMGLDDLFSREKKVSPTQILDEIARHEPLLNEVWHGEPEGYFLSLDAQGRSIQQQRAELRDANEALVAKIDDINEEIGVTRDFAVRDRLHEERERLNEEVADNLSELSRLEAFDGPGPGRARYESYATEGGEGYTEHLMVLNVGTEAKQPRVLNDAEKQRADELLAEIEEKGLAVATEVAHRAVARVRGFSIPMAKRIRDNGSATDIDANELRSKARMAILDNPETFSLSMETRDRAIDVATKRFEKEVLAGYHVDFHDMPAPLDADAAARTLLPTDDADALRKIWGEDGVPVITWDRYSVEVLELAQLRGDRESLGTLQQPYLSKNYDSPHWNDPNVVVHSRFKLFPSEAGRVLLIDEIQSDWHHAGAEKGYIQQVVPFNPADVQREVRVNDDTEYRERLTYSMEPIEGYPDGRTLEYEIRGEKLDDQWYWRIWKFPEHGILTDDAAGIGYTGGSSYEEAQRMTLDAIKGILDFSNENQPGKIPLGPFRKLDDWSGVAFKRMLRLASEAGMDALAWTTGEQQADRYDLREHVSEIEIHTDTPDMRAGKQYYLQAYDFSGNEVVGVALADGELDEHIGTGLAKQVRERVAAGEKTVQFVGDDLSVGGHGHDVLYDKVLAKHAKKLGKKFGAEVRDIQIETADPSSEIIQEGPLKVLRIIDESKEPSANVRPEFDASSIRELPVERINDKTEVTGHVYEFKHNNVNRQISVLLWRKVDDDGQVEYSVESDALDATDGINSITVAHANTLEGAKEAVAQALKEQFEATTNTIAETTSFDPSRIEAGERRQLFGAGQTWERPYRHYYRINRQLRLDEVWIQEFLAGDTLAYRVAEYRDMRIDSLAGAPTLESAEAFVAKALRERYERARAREPQASFRVVYERDGRPGEVTTEVMTEELAQQWADERRQYYETGIAKPMTVHALMIPAELRESVNRGQYLFHDSDRWAGRMLYGTEVNDSIWNDYKKQAREFSSYEQFAEAVGEFHKQFEFDDMDTREVEQFLRAVWDSAHPETSGPPASRIPFPERGDVSQYDYAEKLALARDLFSDPELSRRIEDGDITEADLDAMLAEAEADRAQATAAGRAADREARAERAGLEPAQQELFDLGDEIGNEMDRIEALPEGARRRAQAERRLKDLVTKFRAALFADLAVADELLDEALFQRALLLGEQQTDRTGAASEALQMAAKLGQDLQKAIDEQRMGEELSARSERHRKSKAKIYAKKREDIARTKAEIKARYEKRETLRKVREARKKLMKAILIPPGRGVEYRGYAEMMRTIQAAIDPLSREQRERYRARHTKKFLTDHPASAEYISEEWLNKLYEKADYSIAELEEVYEVINRLRKDGIEERSRIVEAERRFREKWRMKAANAVLRGEEPEKATGRAAPTPKWLSALVATWKPDRVVQLLDGAETGPFNQWLQGEVNKSYAAYVDSMSERLEAGDAKLKELRLTLDPTDRRRLAGFDWLGRGMDIAGYVQTDGSKPTVQDVMFWYIGMQNERTQAALLYGNNIPGDIIMKGIAQLSDRERAMADFIAEDFEGHFEELREAFIDTFNIDLPGEDHYVPHRRLEISYETRSDEVAADMVGRNGLRKQFIARNPTYERIDIADEHQKPIRTDLVNLWQQNIKVTEGFIHQDTMIKRLHSIFESDEVRAAVQQRFGSKLNRWISKLINDLAQADAYAAQTGLERASRLMRSNAAVAYLGGNLSTIMKQFTGPLNYWADAGPVWIASGAAQLLGGQVAGMAHGDGLKGNTLVKFVDERTTLAKHRYMSQAFKDVSHLSNKPYQAAVKKAGRSTMIGLELVDKATIYMGWKGVYDKVMWQTKGDEAAAIEAADKSVIRTQPSARVQDMADIYRQGEIMKWFTMFTSELNTFWNRMSFDVPMAIKRGHIGKAAMEIASLAAIGIGIGVASGFLRIDDDDEDERGKEALQYIGAQFVDAIPIVGNEISNALIFRRFYDQGVRLFPAMQYALGALAELGDEEPDAERVTEQALRAFMMSTGLPMTATMRVKRALEDEDAAALLGWR